METVCNIWLDKLCFPLRYYWLKRQIYICASCAVLVTAGLFYKSSSGQHGIQLSDIILQMNSEIP